MSIFHWFHKYKVIRLFKYMDCSFGSPLPVTSRIYKCIKCNKVIEDNSFKGRPPLYTHNIELSDFN